MKIVAPACDFDSGNGWDSISAILGPFLGFPAVLLGRPAASSVEISERSRPSELNLNNVGVDVGHGVVASGDKPVNTLSWRRRRWLKRWGFAIVSLGCGPPSLGCRASQSVDCGSVGVDVVANETLKAGRCGGFLAPCKAGRGVRLRAEDTVPIAKPGSVVGHGVHRRRGDSTEVSLGVSSRLSSRLPLCPPLVRPAPGTSSFSSLSVPFPPAHFALGCDDVGDHILSSGADASVAQPCLLVPSASTCSSDASVDSLHPAGSCILLSRTVDSICRSVKFNRGKSGNVSAQ